MSPALAMYHRNLSLLQVSRSVKKMTIVTRVAERMSEQLSSVHKWRELVISENERGNGVCEP